MFRQHETKSKLLSLVESPESYTDLKVKLGITDRAIQQHLSDLQEEGLIEKDSESKYILTPKGLNTLNMLVPTGAFEDLSTLNIVEKATIEKQLKHLYTLFHNISRCVPMLDRKGNFASPHDKEISKFEMVFVVNYDLGSMLLKLAEAMDIETTHKVRVHLKTRRNFDSFALIDQAYESKLEKMKKEIDGSHGFLKMYVTELDNEFKEFEKMNWPGLSRFTRYVRNLIDDMNTAYQAGSSLISQ